jgi:hypothetical protein
MNFSKVIGERVGECSGCERHRVVRNCMRCGLACWIDDLGLRLVMTLGTPVICLECAPKPDAILIVKENDFERAVEEAKRYREARQRSLAMN